MPSMPIAQTRGVSFSLMGGQISQVSSPYLTAIWKRTKHHASFLDHITCCVLFFDQTLSSICALWYRQTWSFHTCRTFMFEFVECVIYVWLGIVIQHFFGIMEIFRIMVNFCAKYKVACWNIQLFKLFSVFNTQGWRYLDRIAKRGMCQSTVYRPKLVFVLVKVAFYIYSSVLMHYHVYIYTHISSTFSRYRKSIALQEKRYYNFRARNKNFRFSPIKQPAAAGRGTLL